MLVNSEDIIGTKEIGDLFGVSSSAIVNMQNRYIDFPLPIKRIESGPLFDKNEIIKWGELNNRLKISNPSTVGLGRYKSIAVVGLPKTGKSYTTSIFAADLECFILRRTFSRAGRDFTQCAVKLVVSTNIFEGYVQFHTDNEEIRQYSKFTEENLSKFTKDVNEYLENKRRKGEEISPQEYIEIFIPPSQMAIDIMKENNLSYLVITDTPGVSQTYELVHIAEANLVILVLADSGGDTAQKGFEKIVSKIAPLVASGDACFLYNLKKPCDDDEEYTDMQHDAFKAMELFENEFFSLKKSIVETSMTLLNPSKYVLGIPAFKDKKLNTAENLFRKQFKNIISKSFNGDSLNVIIEELKNAIILEDNIPDDYEEYVQKINSTLFYNTKDSVCKDYILNFKENRHSRVKTQDNYKILKAVSQEREKVLNEIYNISKYYTIENTPNIFNQGVIKLYYKLITEELKGGNGIGVGTHPWEDYPSITMNAIEFILAEELNSGLTKEVSAHVYREILKNNGIISNSWGYVNIDKNNIYKLDLICSTGILKLPSTNLNELVRNRYIGGLVKIGQYNGNNIIIDLLNP